MRIGSRSAESLANREGLVTGVGLPSAETDIRGAFADAGGGGCVEALAFGG